MTKSALLLSADQGYHDIIKGEEQTAAGWPLRRNLLVPPSMLMAGRLTL